MMPVSGRLAIRQWRARPLRPILCSLAIAAAVTLVVCLGVGLDSARASLHTAIWQMLGTAEVQIRPTQRAAGSRLPAVMLEQIRSRSEVLVASPRMQAPIALTTPTEHRWFEAVGVDPQLDEQLRPKNYLHGHALTGNPNEIVLDEAVAKLLAASDGQTLTLSGDGAAERVVTVVGIVAHPQIELLQKPTAYLMTPALAEITGIPISYNVIDLKLAEGTELDAFARSLGQTLGPTAAVTSVTTRQAQFDRETRSLGLALIVLSMVSGTCAALIIATTLSVGVQERIRQFGQLRCIGASRGQLLALLMADAVLLMLGGLLLGFLLGVALSHLVVYLFPRIFLTYHISAWSVIAALANGLFATLVGSLIPAWQVLRITPMEAVRLAATPARRRRILLVAAFGLAAIALQIALWQIPHRDLRFWSFIILGIPLLFVGYGLLGPAVLLLGERLGARLIGPLLGLRPALLRHAWSRTPWRAGAMIAALMIGVTLFTAVQQRGNCLLASWQLPTQFPDLLLFSFNQMPPDRITTLIHELPDIQDATAFSAFNAKLAKPLFRLDHNGRPQDSTLFVCIDPESFPRLVQLEFVQGEPATAYAQLKKGHAVLVSREFYVARGLGVGQSVSVMGSDGQPIDFTIAGVVTSNGLNTAKNYFDMRSLFHDTAISSVLGTIDDATKYFKLKGLNMVMVDLKRDRPIEQTMQDLKPKIAQRGFQSASTVEMKQHLTQIIRRVVDSLSLLAFAALGVASLGVANMVIASIQARRYEFGILRAVGAGRGQLLRLILAEVTFIALAASLLGTLAGLHLTFMATRADRLRVGLATKFEITCPPLLFAFLLTLALAYLASLWPAWRGATQAQRTLLASGRA